MAVGKVMQMTIKCIYMFNSKALQNFPKFGCFGSKTNHLATLIHFSKLSNPFFSKLPHQTKKKFCFYNDSRTFIIFFDSMIHSEESAFPEIFFCT
jgi:hypothetical protein